MTDRTLNQIQDLATNPQELKRYEDRVTKALNVLKLVEDFVEVQRIRVPETIYQSDRVIENAYEFIEELCEVAGYHKDAKEDVVLELEDDLPNANGHYIGLDR